MPALARPLAYCHPLGFRILSNIRVAEYRGTGGTFALILTFIQRRSLEPLNRIVVANKPAIDRLVSSDRIAVAIIGFAQLDT